MWKLLGAVRPVLGERAGRLDLVRDRPGPRRPLPVAGRRRLPGRAPAGRGRPAQPALRRPEPGRAAPPGPGRADDRGLAAAGQLGPGAQRRCSAGGGDNLLSQAISLAYPIGDVVVGTIVLFVLARARTGSGTRGDPAAPARRRAGGHRRGRQRLRVPHRQRLLLVGGADRRRLVPRLPADPAGRPQAGRPRRSTRSSPPPASTASGIFLPYVAVVGSLAVSTVAQVQQGILDYFASWIRSFIIVALVGASGADACSRTPRWPGTWSRGSIERTAELRASEQRFQALVQHSSEVVILVDRRRQGRVRQRVDDRVFGYREADLLDRPLTEILDPEPRAPPARGAWPRSPSGPTACSSWSCRCGIATATGAPSSSPSPTCSTTPASAAWSSTPATSPSAASSRTSSSHQAFHDSLTALANRALFKDRVDHALPADRAPDAARWRCCSSTWTASRRSTTASATPPATGCSSRSAERLRACVRPSDTVARFGGDEFAVLIEDASDDLDARRGGRADPRGAAPAVRGQRPRAARPGQHGHRPDGQRRRRRRPAAAQRRPGHVPGQGGRPGRLRALRPRACTPSWSQRVQLEADLRRALERGRAGPPLPADRRPRHRARSSGSRPWSAGTTRPAGWSRRPSSSPWPRPAGSSGRSARWVLREACRQAAAWQRGQPAPRRPLTLSVNLSGRQLQHAEVVDDVAEVAARRAACRPSRWSWR